MVKKYNSELFSLTITTQKINTLITMRLFISEVNTNAFPQTHELLSQYLPTIFKHKCFNYSHQPFSKEVKKTEIGHLFEHILLENICILKFKKGNKDIKIKGVTDWNWYKDSIGTFHIDINYAVDDVKLFNEALKKTIQLTQIILSSPLITPKTSTERLPVQI